MEAFGGGGTRPEGAGSGSTGATHLTGRSPLPPGRKSSRHGAALLGGDGFEPWRASFATLGLEVFSFLQGVGAFTCGSGALPRAARGRRPTPGDRCRRTVGIQVKDLVDSVAQGLTSWEMIADTAGKVLISQRSHMIESWSGGWSLGGDTCALEKARRRVRRQPTAEACRALWSRTRGPQRPRVRDLRSLGVGVSTGVGELLVELDVAFHGPLLGAPSVVDIVLSAQCAR